MAKDRIAVPEDTAAILLFRSNRCCCVCREKGKGVQVHHIDENPANNDPENLSVLCFECHNQTQLRGGFGRRLDSSQVKQFKMDWERAVEAQRALLPAPIPEAEPVGDLAQRREHDRQIFLRAQGILDEAVLNKFIGLLANGDEYHRKQYTPVAEFIQFWAAAENELIDDDIRERCDAMRRTFDELFGFLASNFFRSDSDLDWFVMHPRLCVDRGGSGMPDDIAKYDAYQERLRAMVDGAYTSWREFRRAVEHRLIV